MDDPTPAAAQTPEPTGLPADLFAKAQAAATEKGRPIYVYRAERAGRFTSKWEPVAGATPVAVIEPLPAADGQAESAALRASDAGEASPAAMPNESLDQLATRDQRDRVTLHTAGGQTAEWQGVSEVRVEDAARVVRFCDADGTTVRVVVGGGSVIVVSG